MITVPLINWQPLDAMPSDRKDGRQVLLWNHCGANVAAWREQPTARGEDHSFWDSGYASEADGEPLAIGDVKWWADINPPE